MASNIGLEGSDQLGDIIKELGLDIGNVPSGELINDGNQQIVNPTQVECPEEAVVFNLVDTTQGAQPQEVQQEFDAFEGQKIMSSITGFGSALHSNINQYDINSGQPAAQQQYMTNANNPMMAAGMVQQSLNNGGQMRQIQLQPQSNGTTTQMKLENSPWPNARLVVKEQPAENKLRFRYECEGRSAGALVGESSSDEKRTYPVIKIEGYKGHAVVVVSLVEKDPVSYGQNRSPKYRVHPHNLVGKDGKCTKGVCSVDVNSEDMSYTFQSLGIQCVKKKDAPASLKVRQSIKVDPFKALFDHGNENIDLNIVRLCFQTFLKPQKGVLIQLPPVVSKVIKDKKAHVDLAIVDYSDDKSPYEGGKKILIFCEQVKREDIEVHFKMPLPDGRIHVAKGIFNQSDVHHQFGISLKTPPYPVTSPPEGRVKCAMYLHQPKSKKSSDPKDFYFGNYGIGEVVVKTEPQAYGTYGDLSPKQEPFSPGQAISPVSQANRTGSANKRGRPVKQSVQVVHQNTTDQHEPDLSSGQITIPPKKGPQVSPAPFRPSGGNVQVVPQVSSQQNYGGYQLPPDLGLGYADNNTQQTQPQTQQGFYSQNQNFEFVQPMGLPQQQQQPQQHPPQAQTQTSITDSSLPNLSMNSSDLPALDGDDVGNLSSNLDSGLKLGKQNSSPSENKNLLGRQISNQLQTPDVSKEINDLDA